MFYQKIHDPLTHRYPRTLREVENNPYDWWQHEPRMGFKWHSTPIFKVAGFVFAALMAANVVRYLVQA